MASVDEPENNSGIRRLAAVLTAKAVLVIEPPVKKIFFISLLTGLLAGAPSANAQSTISSGSLSIDGQNEAEYGYFQLDNDRWIVAVQTRESSRTKVTKRKTPSALIITCKKDQVRLKGVTFFDVDRVQSKSNFSYADIIAISFCKSMQRSFGVKIPDKFMTPTYSKNKSAISQYVKKYEA